MSFNGPLYTQDNSHIYVSIFYEIRVIDQSDGDLTGFICFEKSHKI